MVAAAFVDCSQVVQHGVRPVDLGLEHTQHVRDVVLCHPPRWNLVEGLLCDDMIGAESPLQPRENLGLFRHFLDSR